MAAPITHIVYAQIFVKHRTFNIEDFIRGTSFPDIRYLGVIERENTHAKISNISQISNDSSFKAGMDFHSFIDIKREEILEKEVLYAENSGRKMFKTALKFYEDEIFYKELASTDKIIRAFNTAHEHEKTFNIPNTSLIKWHKLLQKYIAQKPNNLIREELLHEIHFTKQQIHSIEEAITTLKLHPDFNNIVNQTFNKLIQKISQI
jgi:hypothetical protein